MEVARRWVDISHLYSDARPGREPSKDGQEDTGGESRGWASLQSCNVGGLWPETALSWVGALGWKAMKIKSLCPSGGRESRNIARAMEEGHSLGSGKPSRSPHQGTQAAYPSHAGTAPDLSLL